MLCLIGVCVPRHLKQVSCGGFQWRRQENYISPLEINIVYLTAFWQVIKNLPALGVLTFQRIRKKREKNIKNVIRRMSI